MKYNELINFEPITEVVKFSETHKDDYQKNLVKTFVFSKTFKDHLIPLMVRNIDLEATGESFGLQVVGNYGTGKSHLMSLVSLIAEDAQLLPLVQEDKPREELEKISGKFKVLRFELGGTDSLWDYVTYKIEDYFTSLGLTFSFDGHGMITYADKLKIMMSEFEAKFPDKGFLIVIDEMLAYLKGRSTPDKLNQDLQVLQALGQTCDSSKFKFIFGVQEMIYHSPEFQFAASMLQKVNDRYKDIIITKDDVAFIVKNRLLRKDEHQKLAVKEHLDKYLSLFTDMHGRTQDYIDLFPVHPTYFENFERIRIGKSEREILKTLSNQFKEILDQDIPTDNPGLLTYDKYWEDIQKSQDLMAEPDIRKVKEITDTINDKIESYFIGVRASKKVIAKRITNACAIKLLQHELNKQNGTNAEHLVDDLCLTDKLASDRDFLMDIMDSTAQQIITATSGQYFDKDPENGEYHLRVEGGINFDQKIKDYAATMALSQKDEYFFMFLEVNLPLDHDTYRTGFRIWEHSIDWKTHKTYRDGYIFFGNPNEKSTTHPRQHFYMYFMPIFDDSKKKRNQEEDELYFIMDDLSNEFKNAVILYGAARALEVRADSSQKPIYRQKIDELNKKARSLFDAEYVKVTKVDYQGKETPLSGYHLPGSGSTKEQVFSEVASLVFEEWFENERPNYPKFTQLNTPITKDNFDRLVKQALTKIATPEQANRDGEGVLNGLGLWVPGGLDYSHSPYAKSLMQMLKDKGMGKVLNREDIIELVENSKNLWLSKDFGIEAELEFVVMASLSAIEGIEISLSSGRTINATNLGDLKDLSPEDCFTFSHIKFSEDFNEAAIKAMFIGILGRDLSKQLKDPSTYMSLAQASISWANRAVTLSSKIQNGYSSNGITILSAEEAKTHQNHFLTFSSFCDKLNSFNSEAKMKNFKFSVDEVSRILKAKKDIEAIEKQINELKDFDGLISYLQQCKQYVVEQSFRDEISKAITRLKECLASGDDELKADYRKELEDLKVRYADWYLKQYLENRISEKEHTEMLALLDSEEKRVCDILKDMDFLTTANYHKWQDNLNKLKVADLSVNKEQILNIPYWEFNPLEVQGQPKQSVKKLKGELKEIIASWTKIMQESLEDPMVQKNIILLINSEKQLLESFKNTGDLNLENALSISTTIMKLHKGLEKVELQQEGLKKAFNKPMTPDEAIEAFKTYVDQISRGKERDKIRIVLKN